LRFKASKLIGLTMLAIFIISNTFIAVASDYSNVAKSDDNAKFIIYNTLSEYGIKDVFLNVADGRPKGGYKVLVLSYSSEAFDTKKTATEITEILASFLGTVKSGWDCDELWVVVGDTTGKVTLATWHCSREWTEAYIREDMTSEQMISNVFGTVSGF